MLRIAATRGAKGRQGIKTVGGKAPRKGPATKVSTKRKRWFKPSNKLINIKISINTNFNIVMAI
jgi:hypothetical protein